MGLDVLICFLVLGFGVGFRCLVSVSCSFAWVFKCFLGFRCRVFPRFCLVCWPSVARVGGTTFSFLCSFVSVRGKRLPVFSDVFVAPAVVLFAVFCLGPVVWFLLFVSCLIGASFCVCSVSLRFPLF